MKRPYPPIQDNDYADDDDEFIESGGMLHFEPANNELWPWISDTFLAPYGQLYNKDHEHLLSFEPPLISFLWAYTKYEAKGRRVLGQTKRISINAGGWDRDRQEMQLINWFGDVPEYLITLDARVCQVMSDTDFCALIEHELYHIGHKWNAEHEMFEYKSNGEPKLFLRGHDVEEFHGVVQRYGASSAVQTMVDLANDGPTIGKAKIAHACGTCILKLA